MIIKVNGIDEEFEENVTIFSLLQLKGINPSSVVVEHNYEVPQKEQWGNIILNDNDNIEIVKFMGGG